VAQRAVDLQIDGLVIVDRGQEGKVMEGAAQGLNRLALAANPTAAAALVRPWLNPGDSLLLKASRGVALEQLIPLLGALLADGPEGLPS
jgi:UDP-N-acetylmuramoyl-tripeptide--D-alanyl-D-alanine ligase